MKLFDGNLPSVGINRNILECKEVKSIVPITTRGCINRNILECKEYV